MNSTTHQQSCVSVLSSSTKNGGMESVKPSTKPGTKLNQQRKAEQSEGYKLSTNIAMVIILTSLSMLFATLLLGYSVYRVSTDYWPPLGFEKLPFLAPSISSLIILFSSGAYILFERTKRTLFFYWSFLGALGFIASQFNLWAELKLHDIAASSGIFGSLIYSFTWIHLGHVALGIILFLIVFFKVYKKQMAPIELSNVISNTGKYWHFLGIVWLIIFFTLFVI